MTGMTKHSYFLVKSRTAADIIDHLYESTGAEFIYGKKDQQNSVLYLIHFTDKQRTVSFVESSIRYVEGKGLTEFEEIHLGSKVLFFSGKDMCHHPLYKFIFEGEGELHKWDFGIKVEVKGLLIIIVICYCIIIVSFTLQKPLSDLQSGGRWKWM